MNDWKAHDLASWKGVLVQILPEDINFLVSGKKVYWVKILSGNSYDSRKKPYIGDITVVKEADLEKPNKDNLKEF